MTRIGPATARLLVPAGVSVFAGYAVARSGSPLPALAVAAAVVAVCVVARAEWFAAVGLPLALLVPPTVVLSVGSPVPDVTPVRALVFLLFAAALVAARQALPTPVVVLAAAFTAWICVLAVAAPSSEAFREALALTVGAFAPAFVAVAFVRGERQLDRALWALVAAGAAAGAIAIVESALHRHLIGAVPGIFFYAQDRGGRLRAQATFPQPIVLGTALAMILPLALVQFVRGRARRLAGAATALIATGLVLTLSRGPWIGAAVSLLVVVALAGSRFVRSALVVIVLLVVLALTPAARIASTQLREVVAPTDRQSRYVVDYRRALLREAWRYVERHPFGGDLAPAARPHLVSSVTGSSVDLSVSIDNGYARYALETGIVGLILLTALLLTILGRSVRTALRLSGDRRALAAAFAASQAAMLVITATVATLTWEQIGVLFWFVAGLGFVVESLAARPGQ